jgi:hypothetical protein
MSKEIIARRALLGMGAGVGAMALAAQRAEADTPFSDYAFPATGTTTARTMPDRLADIKNVKDFGARGNGSTDDTAAIQAAVNRTGFPYSSDNRGTVYFPTGTYRLTGPITWETPSMHIRFLGEPGAKIGGNFADALLKRRVNSPISGIHVIENLDFEQGHASGKCILAHSCVGVKIVNCRISGPGGVGVPLTNRGIETFNSQAATIDTCVIRGCGVGVVAGNATMVLNCDITGCVEGIRHQNLGLTVIGGRYEVNGTAILIGKDGDGNAFQSSGFDISGLSMESNDHGIYIGSGSAGKISGCAITNNVDGNHSGIYMGSAEQVSVSGCVVASGYAFIDAGIYLDNPKRCSFDADGIGVPSGLAWRLPTDGQLASLSFRACNPVVEGSVTLAQLATHGTSAPIGTILRVSNSNTSTIGAKITSSGAHNVMALKIHGNKWTVLGPGT